ncbi:MAG: DUF3127 domain-containing protein [Bacteroidia bacterium]|nr:DUF3127 domain-containing protein [Bacteroidia bacterium]
MSGAPEYELEGILQMVLPPVPVGRSRYKLPFVVLSDTPRPQSIQFEAYGDLIPYIQNLPLRERVRVRFALEGWLWHPPQGASRYVTRLTAIAVERLHA